MKIAQKIELIVIVGIIAAVVMLLKTDVPSTYPTDPTAPRVAMATPVASPLPGATRRSIPSVSADGSLGIYNMWRARFEEAEMALAQGDNKRAEASLLMALPLASEVGPNALHETLDHLGLACYRLGEYQRSADYERQALAFALALPEENRQATVGLYESHFAQTLEALDDHAGAMAALDRAEQAYRAAYPLDSSAYFEAMDGLAAQHRNFGDNEGAARLTKGP